MGPSSAAASSGLSVADAAHLLGVPVADPSWSATRLTGATLDSRAVAPGELYAALPGANTHGARFAAAAVGAGAGAVLTDPDGAQLAGPVGVPVLVVADPRGVLGALAGAIHGNPSRDLTVIGITGTNGKTTTAYLVESALRASGHLTGLIGTVETRIGDERLASERTTPESPDVHALFHRMREHGVDACVMEVSSHALRLHRVDGVHFDVAVFTNLSRDHLDFHTSMQDYFAAKASLFTPERSAKGVVCVDDEWGQRLAAMSPIPVVTMSTTSASADWIARRTVGDEFTLTSAADGTRLHLLCHLPGDFNIANTALAALTLLGLGLPIQTVESACRVQPVVPGRMEIVGTGTPDEPRCVVDFAHTADAVEAALLALRPSTSGRLIAVLGAGGDRDRGKRRDMGAAAARIADLVIVTDDNPRSEDPDAIRAEVIAGAAAAARGREVEVVDGGARADAIALAVSHARADDALGRRDTVAILGKGHETGQEIAGVKHHFDDREQLAAALHASAGRTA